MTEGKFVSYLRVSTDKQGRSGLGLEAQREAVSRYLNGGRWKLVAEYVEVENRFFSSDSTGPMALAIGTSRVDAGHVDHDDVALGASGYTVTFHKKAAIQLVLERA